MSEMKGETSPWSLQTESKSCFLFWKRLGQWNWHLRGNLKVNVIQYWVKKKTHILLHSKKVFKKIYDPFMIEIISRLQIKGHLLSLAEGSYVTPNTTLSGKRLTMFLLIHQTRMSDFTTCIQYRLKVLASATRQKI